MVTMLPMGAATRMTTVITVNASDKASGVMESRYLKKKRK